MILWADYHKNVLLINYRYPLKIDYYRNKIDNEL